MAEFIFRGMQFAVLRIIPVLGVRACGTEIHEFLQRNLEKELPASQVYVALQRLQDRKLVTSASETERPAGRRGHPRRVYQLSASGLRSLEAGMKLFGIPAPKTRSAYAEGRGRQSATAAT
jgi:DNA-binding PadR family transcriptional regulator